MPNKTRVIQYGLGPIGAAVAKLVTERENLELVGGVDVDPAKVGKDVGAAAVLIAALSSILIGLLILGPPLWERLQSIF